MTTLGTVTVVLLALVVVLLAAILARLRTIESELGRALRRRRAKARPEKAPSRARRAGRE